MRTSPRPAVAVTLLATAAFAFGIAPMRGHTHVEDGHEFEHDHVHGGWHEHHDRDHGHDDGRDDERPRSTYLPAVSADAPAVRTTSVPERIERPLAMAPAEPNGLVVADRPYDPSIPRAPPA